MTNKVETAAGIKATEASIGIKIVRCKCGDPWRIHSCRCFDPSLHIGQPCPSGNEPCPVGLKENLGVVSYWHKNPFKRFAYWFKTKVLKEIYE